MAAIVAISLATLLVVASPVSSFVAPALSRPSKSLLSWPTCTSVSQSRVASTRRPRCTSHCSMSYEPFEEREGGMPSHLPDDPAELMQMEQDLFHSSKKINKIQKLKKDLHDMPRLRQCHRYRWTQTETTFDVEIPMPRPCGDDDVYLMVDQDKLQFALKTDEAFGVIAGIFPGNVDAQRSRFQVHNNKEESYIHLEVFKTVQPGCFELWGELLQGEKESPTIRFFGKTARYKWKQNAETIEVEIPVPDDVNKRKTVLDLEKSGAKMHLSFTNKPDFEPVEGAFKGLISPLDSVWMFDERDDGKILILTLKKRRCAKDTTAWWSGVLEGDDRW